MSKITKKMLIILGTVLALGLITVIPGFAETQEELSKIFVTRDEWNKWFNGGGNTIEAGGTTETITGISQVLESLEENMMTRVKNLTIYEMTRRGMESTSASTTAAGSWSDN